MKLAPFVAFLALAAPGSAQVIHVDDTAVGTNDGTSWQNAFTDLQSALAVAGPKDAIWVARGTYKPTATLARGATFAIDCNVIGGFDGTETSLSQRAGLFDETILSGDLLGDDGPGFAHYQDNSWHVATIPPAAMGVLDGFTVRGGHADHQVGDGGGLYIDFFAFGAFVQNCTFVENYARRFGGGISCVLPWTRVERCAFIGNVARGAGGGMSGGDDTTVLSSRFLGNSAGDSGGGLSGVGFVVDCLFSGNRAVQAGGGAFEVHYLLGCTLSGNTASVGGGAFGPVFNRRQVNSVFWGNLDATGDVQSGQLAGGILADSCVVQGWDGSLWGTGTLDADPLFRSPLGADGIAGTLDDDLRLALGSPCVDTASDEPYRGSFIDALGRPRFVDSLGCDGGGILDRGAIERQAVDGTTTYCESTPTSIGVAAVIGGPCTVDLSGGPFTILSRPIPDGRAFLLMGTPGAPLPFGNGILCLSRPLRRTGAAIPAGGTATFLVNPNRLLPGGTVGLQVLFRDAAADGAGFNLSSAMRLVALP